jgi:O-antigen ligase
MVGAGRRLAPNLESAQTSSRPTPHPGLPPMLRSLTDVPRWILLLSLIYAPWAFGCTRPWTIDLLNAFLGAAVALWMVDCAVQRTRPRVHPVLAGCVVVLLLLGWWMCVNAHWFYDPEFFRFVPVASWWKAGPGTIDQAISFSMMLRVTVLLGVTCFVSDFSRHAAWRQRLWQAVALAATSVVLFGLVQKGAGQPLLPFEDVLPGHLYFATYFYHGNAGAFINLVLPLVVGLAAVASRKAAKAHAVLLPCAMICVAGAFASASRAAAVVTLLLLGALAVWQFRVWRGSLLAIPRKVAVTYVAVAVIGLGAFIVGVLPTARWTRLPGQINGENPRWITTQVCLRMLPDAGTWGLGPGTFALAFPHYTHELGTSIRGILRFAHQDYLQTLIEWGWAGAGVWAVLFFGGLIRCFYFCRRMRSAESALLFTSGLALTGVALHALVDFPLQIASLQLYVAVYLGIGWGSSAWAGGTEDRRAASRGESAKPVSQGSRLSAE